MSDEREIQILLVEDSPGDARLTLEALKGGSVPNRLIHVSDGEEAIAFLCQRGIYAGEPRPDLILLDLNLPRKDGREVLEMIKKDDRFRRIPVVVLTTSEAEEDIQRAYNLYANCYVAKPVDLNQFMEAVKSIERFWLATAKLPFE